MKKILVSMMTIAMVSALIGGGIYAAFSDPETSDTNSFAAGTLDLTIGADGVAGGDVNYNMLTLTGMAPGDDDAGTPGICELRNIGTVSGDLTVATGTVTNTESTGSTEYEADGADGELGGYVQISIWIDEDDDGIFDTTEKRLDSDGTAYTGGSLAFDTVDNYAGKTWTDCLTGIATYSTSEDVDIIVEWQFPDSGDQNDAQGDSCSIGFTFTLAQP